MEVQKYRFKVEIEPPFASAALAGRAGGGSPTTLGPATANMLATASAPGMHFLAPGYPNISTCSPRGPSVSKHVQRAQYFPVTLHHE